MFVKFWMLIMWHMKPYLLLRIIGVVIICQYSGLVTVSPNLYTIPTI